MIKFKLANVVWDCKYHIVLVPKYRCKVFNQDVRESVRDELKKLCTWMRIEVIEGHGSKDHVYVPGNTAQACNNRGCGNLERENSNKDVQ